MVTFHLIFKKCVLYLKNWISLLKKHRPQIKFLFWQNFNVDNDYFILIYRLFTEISNPKTCYWTSKVIWKLPISVGVSMPPHLDEQRCVEPWTTSLQKWWLGNTTMKRWTFGHWECFAMNFYAENLHLKLLHIKQHIKGLWKLIYSFHLTFQQVSETNENS